VSLIFPRSYVFTGGPQLDEAFLQPIRQDLKISNGFSFVIQIFNSNNIQAAKNYFFLTKLINIIVFSCVRVENNSSKAAVTKVTEKYSKSTFTLRDAEYNCGAESANEKNVILDNCLSLDNILGATNRIIISLSELATASQRPKLSSYSNFIPCEITKNILQNMQNISGSNKIVRNFKIQNDERELSFGIIMLKLCRKTD